MRLVSFSALACLALASACAHEVIELGAPPATPTAPASPLGFSVTVGTGSFDASRLSPEGVALHFADGLLAAGLFAEVLHPAPRDYEPVWEIELSASDAGFEPDSNFWKALVGNALPPLLVFVHLQNDYELELTALLLRRREIMGTYRARAAIRHRYQAYADRTAMEREALASLARRATRAILGDIALDLERLRLANGS